ncbi:MAG: hypothetical protein ACLS7Z_10550 [Christensenellales bacterium]
MNKIKLISLLAAAAVMTGSVAMAETYSATGNGYHGEMTVNVTIEDGKITDVELGDNHDERGDRPRVPGDPRAHPRGEYRGCGQRDRRDLLFLRDQDRRG